MPFASKYYSVLGLKENASIAQVKKAYRDLAKKYHPDVCKEPDARERFIEVNEAYEFLTKKPKAPARGKMRSEAYYHYKEKVYKEWVERNKAKVKAKAERAAEMKFNDWEKMNLRGATTFDCLSTWIFVIVIALLVPFILHKIEGSEHERLISSILGILLFISVPALAYFLTWKDYKIADLIKKRKNKD